MAGYCGHYRQRGRPRKGEGVIQCRIHWTETGRAECHPHLFLWCSRARVWQGSGQDKATHRRLTCYQQSKIGAPPCRV